MEDANMFFEQVFPDNNIETDEVEFKGILNVGKNDNGESKEISWVKTLAAFANTKGGSLFVGVEDKTHKIVSFDHKTADRQILLIHEVIKQRLEPIIQYQIIPHKIIEKETRYIIEVKVKASSQLPIFVHDKGAAIVFVRDFALTRLATIEEIRNLVLLSDNVVYDCLITNIDYKIQNFSKLQKKAIERTGKKLTDKQLMSIGFISNDFKLSKGALLFQDDCNTSLARIDVAFYPSINKGSREIISPKTFKGPLMEIIDEVTSFIDEHSEIVWKKNDNGRFNQVSFPKRSVVEGIANSVCHRNYYINTSIIEIGIFVDRLEIVSPGSLLGVQKLEKKQDIASITPRRRNEVIARTLEALNYIENKGSGFDLIVEEYSMADENHKPYIKSDSISFTLVLPNLNYYKGLIDENNDCPDVFVDDVSIEQRDLDILSFCYIKSRTSREIAKHLNLSASTYFRNNILKNLVDKKYLVIDKNGTYPKYSSNHFFVKLTTI